MQSNPTVSPGGDSVPSLRWIVALGLCLSTATMILLLPEQQHSFHVPVQIEEPVRWLGQTLPLLRDTANSSRLAEGSWLVLLADRNCSGCGLLAQKFTETATAIRETGLDETPDFCILSYGEGAYEEEEPEFDSSAAPVCSLRVSQSATVIPANRAILHLHDSKVIQVYAPDELDLVLKVFES